MTGSSNSLACSEVDSARKEGFSSAWISNIFGLDALTAAAVAGSQIDNIDLGTFVVPSYTRHPLTMAQQTISVQDACGGRFTLGIGLSHQIVIETMMGIPFEKPARHMREYLSVLMPLLSEGNVSFAGDVFTVNAALERPSDFVMPKVIVAALGPVMLEMAGTMTDGTATWMTGPKTLSDHIIPTIQKAASKAGKPAPLIVSGLPICVTADSQGARERAGKIFSIYGNLPSYRAMLDREGAAGPAEVAIVGDEEEVAGVLQSMSDCGVTDFVVAAFGTPEETRRTKALALEIGAGPSAKSGLSQ